MVRDLVHDRNPDFLLEELGVVPELRLERNAVDLDLVREDAGVVVAVRERDPDVEPEDVRVLGVLVLDDDLDVRHRLAELCWQRVERAADAVLEAQKVGRNGLGWPAASGLIASTPKRKPPM